MTDDTTTPNENDVKTTKMNDMLELEVKAVIEGKPTVVAILTCLDSADGRRGALHLADNARSLFAADAADKSELKGAQS